MGIRRFVLRFVSFFRSDRAETDLGREIRAHLRFLEDKFVADGMSVEEARYAARRAFGGVEQAKEHQRDERSFRWLAGWSMDLKLGARMLIKYPGLSLVGGAAIAFAIAAGTGTFEFLTQYVHPRLPLEDGDRIVGVRLWHTAARGVEEQAAFDFMRWREQLESIEDLAAFRTVDRNLTIDNGTPEPVQTAEITASGLRVGRVPPLKGRLLARSDEQPGAPPVVVIGYDLWQSRFGGDPAVVGRTVRLGGAQSTVIGVMPERFGFPVAHSAWTPLRLDGHAPRQGPDIYVFGRLAPRVTPEGAQAELTSIGRRTAADFPATHEHLRPEVLPYAQSISGLQGMEPLLLLSINVFLVMLLLLVAANVALLMFARAATRESEIVVRTALGASRGRIMMQLFAEALVLGGAAAAAGIVAAVFLLRWWLRVSEIDAGGRLPFWFDGRIAPATVLYAAGLTILGAVVAGVVPALKVTGRKVETQLRQAAMRTSSLRFGGIWTVVIVIQVAVTVAFPATAFFVRRQVVLVQSLDVGFPAAEYLSARLEVDREIPAGAPVDAARAALAARFRASLDELERRIASEPGVAGVTFTDRLPRTVHPQRWIEVDESGEAPQPAGRDHRVHVVSVVPNYFDVLRAPILSGRAFNSGDLAAGSRVAVVNRSFVDRVLAGRNPIGRQVREVIRNREDHRTPAEAGPWVTIVGVVPDLGTIHDDAFDLAAVYHPAAPGATFPLHMAVHVRGDARAFAPRLRAVAAGVDPTLRLHDLRPLDEVGADMWNEFDFLFRLLGGVSAVALLLSLSGIYAVMSFTVSRRTREIGIRVALGANRRRVVGPIFKRPLIQVGLGVVAGGALVFTLTQVVTGLSAKEAGVVLAYMALMMAVCMLACVVPTHRALRVEPSDALRAE